MILKSLNGDKLAKYGYDSELEYVNNNFHGHQLGISIGVTDKVTGDIVRNFITPSHGNIETRNKILLSIIEDEAIIKVEKHVTQFEEGRIAHRVIWFAPYAVQEHSVFKETANFSNLSCEYENAVNHVVLELLFVEDNLNRYVTASYSSHDVSIMEFINDVFDSDSTIVEWTDEIKYLCDDDDDYQNGHRGYSLDFYDEAGEKTMLYFDSMKRLRDALVSVRLLEVYTIIED